MPADDRAEMAPPLLRTTSSLVTNGPLDAGPGETARGFELVVRVAFGRHDQNGLGSDDRDQVLQAGHVIVIERD
jgi:hypothetical protein